MSMHPEIPSQHENSFEEHLREGKKPRGKQKTIWINIRQDLNSTGIKLGLSKGTQTLNRLLELKLA